MSEFVAINLALIPSPADCQRLGELNRRLISDSPHHFYFDTDHQPHLTLWQDYVLSSRMNDLLAELGAIPWALPVEFTLEPDDFQSQLGPGLFTPGLVARAFEAGLSKAQQQARPLAEKFGGRGTCTHGQFFSPQVHPGCFKYVQNYALAKMGAGFSPHITLGLGESVEALQRACSNIHWPWRDRWSRLVLAQLGDICGELAGLLGTEAGLMLPGGV